MWRYLRLSPRNLAVFAAVVLALAAWSIVALAQSTPDAAAAKAGDPHLILLRTGELDTRKGEPAIDPTLMIGAYPPGELGYYIVQFLGRVEEAWKER